MIDYSEGHWLLKTLVHEMYEACLKNDYAKAKEICDGIVVTARITRAQLTIQEQQELK